MANIYGISLKELFKRFNTSSQGLTTAQAQNNLKIIGYNTLPETPPPSLISRFITQFNDFLILLLLVASGVSFFLGEITDGAVIILIVLLNALIGLIQEYKAERSVRELKKSEKNTAKVLRDNNMILVNIQEIVPGDVIFVEAGDKISADARILKESHLRVDEAVLTGESVPAHKRSGIIRHHAVLAEQYNMLFRDTKVIQGSAYALVTATGKDTRVGSIATLLQETDTEQTPLQKELYKSGKSISVVILSIAGVVFAILLSKGETVINAFLTAVALSVAAIPEGLPAVVAVVLSVGVLTLANKKTIVKKLKAVEALGSIKYLLTDKTGTLTWNKINVVQILTKQKEFFTVEGEGYNTRGVYYNEHGKVIDEHEKKQLTLLAHIMAVCSTAQLNPTDHEVEVIGDTTEGALLVAVERLSLSYKKLREEYEVIHTEPFSSSTKRMVVVVRNKRSKKIFIFFKGAPEVTTAACGYSPESYISKKNENWAQNGLRNLGFAYREIDKTDVKHYKRFVADLQFVGLVGQEDSIRKEVAGVVNKAKQAGIETIMVTGDHQLAAFSVGKKLGIATYPEQVMNAEGLDELSDSSLMEAVLKPQQPVRIFARVSPEQKLRIVTVFKERTGQSVAVTGDGVNDAPAIKAANVGIAMGITGSDVAKEAADVIIADDNYATIVTGIFKGRVIFDNLIKFIRYLLSCNTGEIVVVLFGTLLGQLHILLPVQILFVNLVTDSLPALALGFEKETSSIMRRAPRSAKESVLTWRRWRSILVDGVIIGIVSLAVFYLFLPRGFAYARTAAFLTLIFSQLFQAFNSRSQQEQLHEIGFFSNRFLVGAVVGAAILTILATQFGVMQVLFQTLPIERTGDWLVIVGLSTVVLAFGEFKKSYLRFLTNGNHHAV